MGIEEFGGRVGACIEGGLSEIAEDGEKVPYKAISNSFSGSCGAIAVYYACIIHRCQICKFHSCLCSCGIVRFDFKLVAPENKSAACKECSH